MKHEEHHNQVLLFNWFRIDPKTRDKVMFAIPNAHVRTPRQGAWMKAEGMLKGAPDIFLMEARGSFHGLFIEMKSAKGKPTLDQRIFQDKAMERGYLCQVCNSFESATKTIEDYLAL